MKILTPEGEMRDTLFLRESVYYMYFDSHEEDFFSTEMNVLFKVNDVVVELTTVTGRKLYFPFSWGIVCSDGSSLEYIRFSEFNGRKMNILLYDPLGGSVFNRDEVAITKIAGVRRWVIPQLTGKQVLCSPVRENRRGGYDCALISPTTHKKIHIE